MLQNNKLIKAPKNLDRESDFNEILSKFLLKFELN